ncbi:MAG TPA: hypothetical protein VKU85_08620 [bacterium]|nr:hypothetical protein [bacterium]
MAGLALLVVADLAVGQTVELPVPVVSLTTDSRRNELSWTDVAVTEGRAVTGLEFFYTELETTLVANGSGGFDTVVVSVPVSSPTGFPSPAPPIELVGSYVEDCDYFLRITKEIRNGFDAPQSTPPREVLVLLKYQLWLNIQSVGTPEFEDSLTYRNPGTEFMSPTGLADLGIGIRLNDNIVQPATGLGSMPVSVSGLATGVGDNRGYLVTALSPGGLGPGTSNSLTFRVLGPFVDTSNLPEGDLGRDTTMVATAPGVPIKVMDGMFVTFGAGSAAPGDTCIWRANHLFPSGSKIEANLEAFEGYRVWRADLPAVDTDFTLLGEIALCGDTKTFQLQDPNQNPLEFDQLDIQLFYEPATGLFQVVDRDVHNDFPYRYAVSTYDLGFLGGDGLGTVFESPLSTTGKVYPAPQVRDASQSVYTVPNPYKRSAAFQEGTAKIVFANLPPTCTIRIFTVAADHVVTLEHGPTQPLSTSPTSTSWDLVSEGGKDVVPGIYIFYVESADGFRQTGKMIIAR